jgi:hypothetical protein
LPIILDIYIENPRDGETDHYLTRSWIEVPRVGDTIVHSTDDGEVWEGEVKKRLFCTGDDSTLRVQLHCERPTVDGASKEPPAEKEPQAPADTL